MSASTMPQGTELPPRLERTVALSEATSFARDLGGTIHDVLVAAVGRALQRAPGTACELTGHGEPVVAVAPPRSRGRAPLAVPEARQQPLPVVRRAVGAVLAGWPAIDRAVPDTAPSVVVCITRDPDEPAPPPGPSRAVVRLVVDDPAAPFARLAVELDEPTALVAADDLLDGVARLLELPYRRLL